ncbi:MAG: prephenate dehydrogenase [Clostridiales bacterium]|nr:prephenate dehydrogenase [Clostridiales bacterium]
MKKVLIVGLGLIGGSILKGLQTQFDTIYGLDRDEQIMKTCYDAGLIKNKSFSLDYLKESDIVFVCLYPEAAIEFIREEQVHFKSGAIVTDVVGLKVAIMDEIRNFIREDVYFIGGHPMAGREGRGFAVSSEEIFRNANYLLVVEENTPYGCVNTLEKIIIKLGCKRIEVMDAKSHDDIIAYTSHMPHILSTVFMSCDRFDNTKYCVAGSFKDMTRVSDINAQLWSELILDNKDPVLNEIKRFKEALDNIEQFIESEDVHKVVEFLEGARIKKVNLGIL